MDRFQQNEELVALRELRAEYEKLLEICGINLNDFSEEIQEELKKYGELKYALRLHDLSLSSVQELYAIRKKDELDRLELKMILESDIRKFEKTIEKEESQIKELENFINSVKEIPNNTEKSKSELEAEIEVLKDKLKSLAVEDTDLDRIISKVEQLEATQKKE